ncbi:MAG: PEP-CTERM sorting domain-containing protein [Phycisphaerae bacterium]|nr:PEP-CTERM sorting domain-containing protein [Phycisphaerae bacterium]
MFKGSVLVLAMVLLGALGASAHADGVISMNIVTVSENFLSPELVPGNSFTAGVVPAAKWNDSTTPSGAWMGMHDDAGTWNGAEFTMYYTTNYTPQSPWPGYSAAMANEADNKLLSGHVYNQSGTDTLAQFRYIPYAAYDVYIYYNSAAVTNNYQTFAIDGTSFSAVGSELTMGADSAFVLSDGTNDANYVKFSNVNLAEFTLRASSTGSSYSYFNGFQIVEVPEPMTIGLLAFGGLLLRRRV